VRVLKAPFQGGRNGLSSLSTSQMMSVICAETQNVNCWHYVLSCCQGNLYRSINSKNNSLSVAVMVAASAALAVLIVALPI